MSLQKQIGEGVTNSQPDIFQTAGLYNPGTAGKVALVPPYDPIELVKLVQSSSILPQAIAAMSHNVIGFGYTLSADPSLKPGQDGSYAPDVTAEKDRLDFFFTYGHPDCTWVTTCRNFWRDLESTGNAYLELLRDGKGDLSGWEKLDPTTIRLTDVDRDFTEFPLKALRGTAYEELTYRKRFRRFVQLVAGRQAVYFKEFGDPRNISSQTGHELTALEIAQGVSPATEVLFLRIYQPGTPYGIPRWVGTMPAVAGARAADEVNWSFFDNKSVPPYFVLVSGGTLTDKSIERITNAIQAAKGRDKYHSAVILETNAAGGALAAPNAKPTAITVQPMTQQQDGLFQEYDKNSRAKVRSAFLLPPLFVGESEDYSHATAQASQEVAESQVFAPERALFDELINRTMMPALDTRYWHYKTNTIRETDPQERADLLVKLAQQGALTAGELRVEAQEILGKDLEDLQNAEWLNKPLVVWLQEVGAKAAAAAQEQGDRNAGDRPGVKVGDQAAGKQIIRKSLAGVETVRDLVAMLIQIRKELVVREAAGELAS